MRQKTSFQSCELAFGVEALEGRVAHYPFLAARMNIPSFDGNWNIHVRVWKKGQANTLVWGKPNPCLKDRATKYPGRGGINAQRLVITEATFWMVRFLAVAEKLHISLCVYYFLPGGRRFPPSLALGWSFGVTVMGMVPTPSVTLKIAPSAFCVVFGCCLVQY